MIKWFRKNKEESAEQMPAAPEAESVNTMETESEALTTDAVSETVEASETQGFFSRFKQGLSKTRHQLGDSIGRLLLGKKTLDPQLFEELETILLRADIGIEATQAVLAKLTGKLERKELNDGDAVFKALKDELESILHFEYRPLDLHSASASPFVILMIGVNGAGKTTTIGKLAHQYQQMGKKVMLAAGDTFRAAAVEQLKIWGERNNIPVIAQQTGADSASVVFDALQAAKARGVDVLIADTAGRLHTQMNLMEELKKIKRVMKKLDPEAPHETMLVLDASIGQNALNQARKFHQDIEISGIAITKLDGSAKGGILFPIANELKIPFRYIGVGEGIEDLKPFDAAQFVSAIFGDDHIKSDK